MATISARTRRWRAVPLVTAILVAGATVAAQPNPYRRVTDRARLPAGMKWAAVIGAEPGPDGNIYETRQVVFGR